MQNTTNTTGIAISANESLTMSSREIADLTDKEHKNVLADIRKMLTELGKRSADFSADVPDSYGRPQPGFMLPKEECLILVSGYSTELRAKIIRRWIELEEHIRDPMAALNDPAAMRGLLLTYTEKVIALEARVEADKPKTTFYDAYLNADGLYGLQNAARALHCRPNLFIRWLKEHYLFYQGGNLVARVQFIQAGHFEVKTTLVDDKARPQAFITPKGLEYLAARAPDSVRLRGAA